MSGSLLVTGGAGFIGSNFIRTALGRGSRRRVVNLDALTYAGNLESLRDVEESPDYAFVRGDVAEPDDVRRAFDALGPGTVSVVHFAAESHVDRSIQESMPFLRTNVIGTQVMLDTARERGVERFVHVSTDEVYGSLAPGVYADEQAKLAPGNPYSASKAASDHLALAAANTHGLPVLVTRCSNNYGPYQFPEKFLPLMIANAMEDRPLPLYGDGLYERDWIHVLDHCEALLEVLDRGRPGEIYNIAADDHRTNLDLARRILESLGKGPSLVTHVEDRPGHDRRYAPDATKLRRELGWQPRVVFEEGLKQTTRWYGEHREWLDHVRSGEYRAYYEKQYGRL